MNGMSRTVIGALMEDSLLARLRSSTIGINVLAVPLVFPSSTLGDSSPKIDMKVRKSSKSASPLSQ